MHTPLALPPPFESTLRCPSSLATSSKTSPSTPPVALSCASSLKTSSSYSHLSFVSSTSSITTMATTFSAATRTDMFEQLFQRLEEESEQRAREEEEREMLEGKLADSASTIRSVRDRRRGSISISRYGEPTAASAPDTRPPSARESRTSSIIVPKPAFYQLDSRQSVQPPASGSTDSFASDTTSDPSLDDVEDSVQHVAQTHFIPAQSISKAISRRLSRARDLVPLASPSSTGTLVIGVAVEANTVEHTPGDAPAVTTTTTTIYSNTLRTQRSTPGLNERANFFAKAKDITAKFRRKSVAALTPASR